MNPQHTREEEIFDGALQLPLDQRENYVRTACGDDSVLRRRVEELLRSYSNNGETMELAPELVANGGTLVMPSVLSRPSGEKAGDTIGPYKLLQPLGEGGCGTVFLAEQEQPVRRQVALKVIKLGMDTQEVVARFEAERQALALMDHPNIAKVFDAGSSESGRPFFVMELVRGVKITEYCDEHNLSTTDRLELFTQVCRAIHHAHQKGIIHRDIKPSNVLVTEQEGVPTPKIIDFGIAKAINQRLTEKTLFTQLGQFIGTPAYMSPEQAELTSLDIDTRSDIYSLGVLLYELLTGKTPLDAQQLFSAGFDAMRRAIVEQEPPRPSTKLSTMVGNDLTTVARQRHAAPPKLIHFVKGDLDWIVMKALEKDRSRRYESASGFAADVQNFLRHDIVEARPPSAVYRFQKMARRHRLAFAAGTAVAASLIVGLSISTWMYFKEKEARQVATRETVRSREVDGVLKDMLKSVGPEVALGRDTALLRDILTNTLARVRGLKDQPEVQEEMYETIGDVYRALGYVSRAEQIQRKAQALQLRGVATGKSQDPTAPISSLAMILCDQWRLSEAEALNHEALEQRRKIYGPESSKTAISMNNLGIVLRKKGKLSEAEQLHLEALAIQKKNYGASHPDIAATLSNLGWDYRDQGNLPEAEKYFRQALDMEKKLLGQFHPGVAVVMDNLAFVLREEQSLTNAETLERESLDMVKKLFGEEHFLVANGLNDLGQILADEGDVDRAEDLERRALAMRRRCLGDWHPETANSLDDLAQLLRRKKKLGEARSLAEQSLSIRRKVLGEDHVDVAGSLNTLGLIDHDEQKLLQSEKNFRDALILFHSVVGAEHPWVATTLENLALTLQDEGNFSEAESDLREALAIRKKLLDPSHPAIATTQKYLAHLLQIEAAAGPGPGQVSAP